MQVVCGLGLRSRRRRKNKTERLVGRRKGKEGGNQYFKAWFYTGQSCLKSKHLHRAGNFILYIWITNVLKAVSWCPVIKHPSCPVLTAFQNEEHSASCLLLSLFTPLLSFPSFLPYSIILSSFSSFLSISCLS